MKRRAYQELRLFSLLLLIILPGVGVSRARSLLARPDAGTRQNQDVPQANREGPYAIRTNVDLVILRASVRDHKGAPISGLNKEDFQVYEDKVLQQIESFSHEDIPVTAGLVIHKS